MLQGRKNFGIVLGSDDKLYAIGGNDGYSSTRRVERYDFNRSEWEKVAPLIYSREKIQVYPSPFSIHITSNNQAIEQ